MDWKDGPSYEAVISAIDSEAIWVRKVGDNAKVCMYVTRLVNYECQFVNYECQFVNHECQFINYECQFDSGSANSFSSCAKVIQIKGQGECIKE